jgi:hypothetical protein
VRWLCVPCHRRWDKREPKHATVIVGRWESPLERKGKSAVLERTSESPLPMKPREESMR